MLRSVGHVTRSLTSTRGFFVYEGMNGTHVMNGVVQVRNKTWFKGFRSQKKDSSKKMVIEEGEEIGNKTQKRRIRHMEYTDMDKTRLVEKLRIRVEGEFDGKDIHLLNSLYMQLYTQTKASVPLDNQTIGQFLEKTIDILLGNKEMEFPEYLSPLMKHVQRRENGLSETVLVKVVLLLSSRSAKSGHVLQEALDMVSTSNDLSNGFILSLIEGLRQYSLLSLGAFETVSSFAVQKGLEVPPALYSEINEYIEKLYEKSHPKVHEFRFKERNLFRVQEAVTNVIGFMDLTSVSIDTVLVMLKLSCDLCSANRFDGLDDQRIILLDHLNSKKDELIGVFLRQDSEELLDSFLYSVLQEGDMYSGMVGEVFESIVKSPIFFSSERIIQAKSVLMEKEGGQNDQDQTSHDQNAHDQTTQVYEAQDPEQILFNKISLLLESNECDDTTLYIQLLEAFVIPGKVHANGVFVSELTKAFDEKGVYPPLKAYKLRIDSAMKKQQYQTVVDIFETSLARHILWSEESGNIIVLKTLNDVIISGCKRLQTPEDVFALFTKVKQHMNDQQANVYAITELANRMLSVEYVGDCIEMLKRELQPKMSKSSSKAPIKAPSDESFGEVYKKLFNKLHGFVTEYTNEETFETNWVLYGTLHNIFNVPYDTYLPAMKFFCEHGRLNASLVILKKIQELSETKNTPAPSRDMYMYLFEQFGDKLYKDGVDEVHELLKLDVALPKQDIDLQNSILNAYCNLQEVGKVKDLFLTMNPLKQSLNSETSINENTAKIVIKAYTYSDLGLVKTFWNNLSRFGVLPNYDLFRQYLIAHVYHGLPDEAIGLINAEMDDYGLEVTEDTLASLYNFCFSSKDQNKISSWAETAYPTLWESTKMNNLLVENNDYEPETSLLVEPSTEKFIESKA